MHCYHLNRILKKRSSTCEEELAVERYQAKPFWEANDTFFKYAKAFFTVLLLLDLVLCKVKHKSDLFQGLKEVLPIAPEC